MSKKNKENDQFNNPFSSLKGLTVSGENRVSDKPASAPVVQPQTAPEDSDLLFAEDIDFDNVMTGLGVKEIARDGLEKSSSASVERPSAVDADSSKKTGKIGSAGHSVARPRRDKQLRRGQVLPEAELDLHGIRAEEVQNRVGWFLENARFHGFEVVRIITGKGSHSVDGPIIRPLVENYLDGAGRKSVVEWMRAPRKQGGEGAVIAFLRRD